MTTTWRKMVLLSGIAVASLPITALNAVNVNITASVAPSCSISGAGVHVASFVPPLSSKAKLTTNSTVTTNDASFAVMCNVAAYKLHTDFTNGKKMVNAAASPVAGFSNAIPINRAILRKNPNTIVELLSDQTLNNSPVLPIMNQTGYQVRFVLGPVAEHLQAGDYSESITITVVSA